jgi:hypothetical protein
MENQTTTNIDTTQRQPQPHSGVDDAEMNSSAAINPVPTVLEQLYKEASEPLIPEQISDVSSSQQFIANSRCKLFGTLPKSEVLVLTHGFHASVEAQQRPMAVEDSSSQLHSRDEA